MVVLETVALNLATAGLAESGAKGKDKVKDILRRRRFSKELDDLETEFNTALREQISTSVSEAEDGVSAKTIKKEWSAIAAHLTEIDIIFESEEEAVSQIAAAIEEGLKKKTNTSDLTKKDLEHVIANVYGNVLREFRRQIAGTELADILSQEADVKLTSQVNEVLDRLESYQRQREASRDAEIRNQGFVRLSEQYFDRRVSESPARCWRTGFEISEVHSGYAVPRETVTDDGSRIPVADLLIDELSEGDDCVMLGPPGSGKSTICKHVACWWHNNKSGDVLYRLSDRSKVLTDSARLEEHIRGDDGQTLMIVEDAIRDEAKEIFRLIQQFNHDSQVVFLLDSREGEWHGSDTNLTDARLQEIKDQNLSHHTIPQIDERECERIVKHFEETTGVSVADSPSDLFRAVDSESGIGEILQLSYHLTFYTNVSATTGDIEDGMTSLEKSIENIVDQQRGEELSLEFGILLNFLNTTDIGVFPELIHTLAESKTDHQRIDDLLREYEGKLVFTEHGKKITDQTDPLRANHEFWSTLYLEVILDVVGEKTGVRIFESCLQSLLTVFDNEEVRQDINRWFREEMAFFEEIEADADTVANGTIESIFKFGRRQPNLAPLFGTTKFSAIELPEVSSPDLEVRVALWRGIIYYNSGDYDTAKEEFEIALRLLDELPDIDETSALEIQGWCRNYVGAIERDRGNLEAAHHEHQESEQCFRDATDHAGLAFTWYNLGKLYWTKSDFDTAQEYLQDALKRFDDIGDRRYVSVTLNNIGLVHRDRGRFDDAEHRLRSSLENAQVAGDNRSEARCLNHLGEVERYRGNYDEAEKYYQQGLKTARKIGDKQGKSWLVHNLGVVLFKRGNLDRALEYFEQSREISNEMGYERGVAISFNYEAKVKHILGQYEAAIEDIKNGLKLVRDVGDRRREGELLQTRGVIARRQGRLNRAEEYLSDSEDIFKKIGDRKWRSDVLNELGSLALERGSIDLADDLYQEALEMKQKINDQEGEADAIGGLGRVAQHREEYETAAELYRKNATIGADIDDIETEAWALSRLGNLAHERGEHADARNYLDQSYELFSNIDDRLQLARIERKRGQIAFDREEIATAQERFKDALQTYREVGDRLGQAETLVDLAGVLEERDDIAEACNVLNEAVQIFEDSGITDKIRELLEELIRIREAHGESVEALRQRIETYE